MFLNIACCGEYSYIGQRRTLIVNNEVLTKSEEKLTADASTKNYRMLCSCVQQMHAMSRYNIKMSDDCQCDASHCFKMFSMVFEAYLCKNFDGPCSNSL